MKNVTLLALDTATEACSVALLRGGEKAHLEQFAQREHTKHILPMVDEILAQAGIKLYQVDALVFGRGPGSFTGVRIGAGIAQGLAFGANLPVIPVSNLAAMAQAAYVQYQSENVLTAIDARMNEVYFAQWKARKVQSDFGTFLAWQPIIAEQVCSASRVLEQVVQHQHDNAVLAGTGWTAYPQLTEANLGKSTDITLPSALYMLDLALPKWFAGETISPLEIEPIYLRNEVTWKKLPGRE
ncbi:tRNA (adenosine(37)-N6)-threonylcarbamoyltransferase complex dimerization subunit type 1 TsaB [Aggregatibacter actinomycetemcomitans]|uniref:tRNA (adenosine(37)-N6)-threonylcarbamoyltransferase complex dimerization subunit type 1 TsaB n=1 Tax=Aggregatibacter actinomycetemcomitans TaxID=714 RepID=UPI0011DA2979|nr:tRNA (adenosine(37)-N6)-threonylcarbamoyltransferase complex dimerization subunit type 1 TsaB [Aggregatibacter actinomycetemcomitans]TYA30052.1 tRNA (adenosine(37)-N6)-threonylcarbamoyltransferase complex dimerization subunit type 1 TsaB [Aggregatibacter actinomycetemcomitans]TYA43502.1 tRNA (adenosine(37)-N6)-threonylcarbamoyltransferase complex dimerization subunit type 1 TsaB [Aggregatibacter actinomycetemcomitans]TYB04566.1 tRNA (adenosine(37)-N6)-threonylcarbamoyltransferase complex dime